jgi:hypothetical protein
MPFAIFGILEVALLQIEPMAIGFVMKLGVLGCLGVWAMITLAHRRCEKAYSLSTGSTPSL